MSASLSQRLLAPGTFEPLVADCRELVEARAHASGPVVRTVFNLVQRSKPGLVDSALRLLLPEFARELDPFHAEAGHAGGDAFAEHVLAHRDRVAGALLAVTDRRVERLRSKTLRGAYARLRGRARAEVVAALPAVAAIVARHTGAAPDAGGPRRKPPRRDRRGG